MAGCGGGYLPHRYSKENGYSNPSVYCDDLYATFEHMQGAIEKHLYISKSNGERVNVREAMTSPTR